MTDREALRERVYHAAENLLYALALIPTAYPLKLNKYTDAIMDAIEEHVKPLTEALERIAHDGETEWLACSDIPFCSGGDNHADDCAVGIARAALDD